tara:strand:+ start:162 stop:341 length:180 start_codon:yes stop_codon:yes gene_type:complete
MPHMYNHTEPNRVITKPTKKGMKTHTMPNGDVQVKKPTKKVVPKQKKKPLGKVKKTISY